LAPSCCAFGASRARRALGARVQRALIKAATRARARRRGGRAAAAPFAHCRTARLLAPTPARRAVEALADLDGGGSAAVCRLGRRASPSEPGVAIGGARMSAKEGR
jgi:hypothetical protein